MAKLDLTRLTLATDTLLKTTGSPRHRQVLEVYRRHVLLEVMGRWEEILVPDMTAEYPIYRINAALSLSDTGGTEVFEGPEEVRAFYQTLMSKGAPVMTVENESLAVADWGFASESILHHQVPGAVLRSMGEEIEDPNAIYVQSYYIVAIWHYDDRARLVGEHLDEAKPGSRQVIKLSPDDVITQEDVREKLMPLIRPLPVFDPAHA